MKQNLGLCQIELSENVTFQEPQKKIHEAHDVPFFLSSKAYTDILTFLLQLNASMFPRKPAFSNDGTDDNLSVKGLEKLLLDIERLIDEAPPEPGPRRFGNIAFRTWSSLLAERSQTLLDIHLPEKIVKFSGWKDSSISPALELQSYLLGSFGSSQRLDYGTGHELSFLAFLGCIWKLKGFPAGEQGVMEKKIVLGVIVPYLEIVRKLIKTYNLEPAGSHGVWGLDDHSFVPYIFGSAQLSPIIQDIEHIPTEGSGPDAPDPGDIATSAIVERERNSNMYFGAIGFITDVKKGPFWEHSPMLYDISGVKAGWAKINKGMIKMYIAEVLSKFPVVQHFPFGNMFTWERDADALPISTTTSKDNGVSDRAGISASVMFTTSAAPWASSSNASARAMQPPTQAPWAASQRHGPVSTPRGPPTAPRQPALRNPMAKPQARENAEHELPVLTKAPWATPTSRPP